MQGTLLQLVPWCSLSDGPAILFTTTFLQHFSCDIQLAGLMQSQRKAWQPFTAGKAASPDAFGQEPAGMSIGVTAARASAQCAVFSVLAGQATSGFSLHTPRSGL